MKPFFAPLILVLALSAPRLRAEELPPAEAKAETPAAPTGFVFGSYGRVTASSDGAGGSG